MFYSIRANVPFWGLSWTLLPPLILDVIYGHSPWGIFGRSTAKTGLLFATHCTLSISNEIGSFPNLENLFYLTCNIHSLLTNLIQNCKQNCSLIHTQDIRLLKKHKICLKLYRLKQWLKLMELKTKLQSQTHWKVSSKVVNDNLFHFIF